MTDTSVKVFKSTDAGAPALSGTAGALIAVLDACLLNGYNLLTAQSVAISGGMATATFATAHGFAAGRVALVAGATQTGLNGEKRVISATTNSLTFDATGIADGSATGTITLKMAPAGWSKPFSGANLAVYKPTDPAARTQYLRVDDTGTTDARVCAYETMTDANTGTRRIPVEAQVAGGNYWPKANNGAGARPWVIVADGKTGYFWLAPHANSPFCGYLVWFGDLNPRRSMDAYAWGLSGGVASVPSSFSADGSMGYCIAAPTNSDDSGLFVARGFTGLGGSMGASKWVSGWGNGTDVLGGALSKFSYPNGPDNSLTITPMQCLNRSHVRACFPGLYATPQAVGTVFNLGDLVEGIDGLAGRSLLALPVGAMGYPQTGMVFIDVTGPWQ